MRTHILSILLAGSLVVLACGGNPSADEAAEDALRSLRNLATEQTYRKLGFESLRELDHMTLGAAMPVYFVGLRDLRNYRPGALPGELLADVRERLYPILVGGKVRAALGMSMEGKSWQANSFGQPRLARSLERVRSQLLASAAHEPSDYFVVEIPALYLVFVGRREGGRLFLTHVQNETDLDFKAGETELGEELVAKLAEVARRSSSALAGAE